MKRWDFGEGAKIMGIIFGPVLAIMALCGLWTIAMMRIADNYGIDPMVMCIAPLGVGGFIAMFVSASRI